jgi:hypothetical protein
MLYLILLQIFTSLFKKSFIKSFSFSLSIGCKYPIMTASLFSTFSKSNNQSFVKKSFAKYSSGI